MSTAGHPLNGLIGGSPQFMPNLAETYRYGTIVLTTPTLTAPDASIWRQEIAVDPMTLTNGANNNVTAAGTVFVEITGPTGAFSITGVQGGGADTFLAISNPTGQAMTIVHESGSSTAGNRFTLDGATDITGQEIAFFAYDTGTSRWIPSTSSACQAARYVVEPFDATAIAALDLPMRGQTSGTDSHYVLAIGVDEQERLHVVGNTHAQAQNYIRSNSLTGGTWPPTWTEATKTTLYPSSTGVDRTTYNYFNRLADGTLLWCHDQQDSTSNTRGRDILGWYLPPGAGTTWQPMLGGTQTEIITSGGGTPGANADRAYCAGLTVTPAGWVEDWEERIHLFGIWRTGDTDPNTQKDPFYLWCRASALGGTTGWNTINADVQPMPIKWDSTTDNRVATSYIDELVAGVPQNTIPVSRNFGWGVAIDRSGYPSVILQNGGTDTLGAPILTNPLYSSYVVAAWNGTQWTFSNLYPGALGASSGPTMGAVGTDVYVICQGPYNGTERYRCSNNNGIVTTNLHHIGGLAPVGNNPNPGTVELQSGVLAILVPDGDLPRVFEFGGGARYDAQ